MINGDVSDLFFNYDLSSCKDEDGNWMMHKLKQEAVEFLVIIENLTGLDYDPDTLLDDFFARM